MLPKFYIQFLFWVLQVLGLAARKNHKWTSLPVLHAGTSDYKGAKVISGGKWSIASSSKTV